MIEINVHSMLGDLADKLKSVNSEAMLHEIASSVLGNMRVRIHTDGLASDGSQIGTYSKGYLVTRSGAYQNSKPTKSKPDAGFFTKGKDAIYDIKSKEPVRFKKKNQGNSERPRYNRGTDDKVILSLTRQMENDMRVIPLNNGFGIGYSNEFNFNKAIWNEARYKKEIFSLSVEESNIVEQIAERFIDELLDA